MSYWTRNLIKLAFRHPLVLSGDAARATPLLPDVDDKIVLESVDIIPAKQIRSTLQFYRKSRQYLTEVSRGKHLVDYTGASVRPPTSTEIKEANDWLARNSIENCIALLRNPDRSDAEKSDAVAILEWDVEILKAKSSRLSRTRYLERTLAIRLAWLEIARALAAYEPTPRRQSILANATYYASISSMLAYQFDGRFADAREMVTTATKAASEMDERSFFPNFFRDPTELGSHDVWLDAAEAFTQSNFDLAGEKFAKWMGLNAHRRSSGDATFDANVFNHALCLQLANLTCQREADWQTVESLLSQPNLTLHRTTRALWDHAEPLVAATRTPPEGWPAAGDLANLFARVIKRHALLSTAGQLVGIERAAGIEEDVRLPRMIDLFHLLGEIGDYWPFALRQMLRHALILRGDYESRLADSWPSAGTEKPVDTRPTSDIELLNDQKLLNYTSKLLKASSHSEEIVLRWTKYWQEAQHYCNVRDFGGAIASARQFHHAFRAVPHILKVTSVLEHGYDRQRSRRNTPYTVTMERYWRDTPSPFVLDTAKELNIGEFVYMKPRWNKSLKTRYHLVGAGEPILSARAPIWMEVFSEWSAGRGATSSDRFLRWCEQIEPRYRAIALRLLSRITFYSEADIRSEWRRLFREILPADAKGSETLLVPVGQTVKSGQRHMYPLRQALADLPESEAGFLVGNAIQSADTLAAALISARNVVIFDDTLGSGDTICRFIQSLLEKHSELATRRVYVATLVGFRGSMRRVEAEFSDLKLRCFAARILEDCDRAFCSENPMWDSDIDRKRASSWARTLGESLVSDLPGLSPARDALGYKDSQALLAFSYNVPNNTLPLFWADGEVRGRPWTPLFERYS